MKVKVRWGVARNQDGAFFVVVGVIREPPGHQRHYLLILGMENGAGIAANVMATCTALCSMLIAIIQADG
jgi:hypothetical protein